MSEALNVEEAHLCTYGHGAYAHVDYVSPVIHHCPSTRCAAYAQQTLKTQDCMCGAPLADYAIVNPHRISGALPNMLESFVSVQNIGSPSNVGAVSASNNVDSVLSSAYCSLSFPQPLPIGDSTVDDDAANGYFYDHSNAMYSATPDTWAGSDA
ncbi:hypothetical protein EDD85DRAFT_1027574 [Armillaria nabsnona]|nr:hypothetical protein EDD85DRAFT_1027574 [Armillaria nabsnona]